MKRITKTYARKLFNAGHKILLVSSKMRLEYGCPVSNKTDNPFDAYVNAYAYYNCTPETGRVVHYYRAD